MREVAKARVVTAHAAKYAAQLGKHWAHNLQVEEAGKAWRVTFPRDARDADWRDDALVVIEPDGDALLVRIDASEVGQRDGLKTALERHLERFAFREGSLTYDWLDLQEGDVL